MEVRDPSSVQLKSTAHDFLSSESPLPSSIKKKPESIKFQVPDEDNDSVSDQSREGSVHAVECARAYSVPSSEFDLDSEEDDSEEDEEEVEEDEEEEEEAEEEGEEEEEDEENIPPSTPQSKVEKPLLPPTLPHEASKNPGATPEHPIEVWAEPGPAEDNGSSRSKLYLWFTKGKNNNAGSSDMNPIDLEGEAPNSISDQGSEDEGPEILSSKKNFYEAIKFTLPSAVGQNLTSKPSALCSYSNPLHSSDQRKERDGVSDDNSDAVQSKVQSQASVAIPMQESGQAKPINNSTYDFDSCEQDDLDTHTYFHEYPERSFVSGSSRPGLPDSRPSIPSGLREINTSENIPGNATSRHNWSHRISLSGAFDVSQVTNSDAQRTAPRPPSPSDAALAKNANTTVLHGHWPFVKAAPSNLAPNDLPYLSYVREAYQKEVAPWLDTCSVSSNAATCSVSSNQAREGSLFDAPDPAYPRYEEGPFASHIQRGVSPAQPSYWRQHASSLEQRDSTFPSATRLHAADKYRTLQTENPSPPVTSHNTSMTIAEVSEYHAKGHENHPSRLNIADIVNPLADTSRNLKRKADDMSKDDPDKHDFEQPLKFSPQLPPFERMDTEDADAYFDDAQPRETIVDGEHNLFRGSSIEPIAAPYQNLEVAMSQDVTGPASKKRKTSSSSAMGVSRFVSGVLVGLAGAFAAFIATIPISVQEEALREISKAA